MKVLLLVICIYKVITISCPNLCSGHGTCETGSCVCYPGTCPYGQSFSVAGAEYENEGDDLTFYLECSAQGSCNRQTGLCECYPGYSGNACQRMKCPNDCSGHGYCYPLEFLGVQYDSRNIKASLNETSYTNSEITESQATACVCDKEYTGVDCSERKCPTGYVRTSDCESPSDPPQIIKFGYTNKDKTNKEPCMAYLEYTDYFGRVWYSDAFCVVKGDRNDVSKVNFTDAAKDDKSVLGWKDALLRFPIGVIALVNDETKLKCNKEGEESSKNYECEMTIRLDQISGRQKQIKLITANDLTENSKIDLDYHGMSKTELESFENFGPYVESGLTYDSLSGVSPTSCSSSGICNKATGTCECFSGFTGISCSEISEAV